jgi:hypothetical protein
MVAKGAQHQGWYAVTTKQLSVDPQLVHTRGNARRVFNRDRMMIHIEEEWDEHSRSHT